MKTDGSLEKKLVPLGYRVEWREFPGGPPSLEALNAAALDVARTITAGMITLDLSVDLPRPRARSHGDFLDLKEQMLAHLLTRRTF